jgi:hypothetical protein
MEYSGGVNLVKLQWDAIHSPGLVIGLFERDEDGMAVIDKSIELELQAILKQLGQDAFILLERVDAPPIQSTDSPVYWLTSGDTKYVYILGRLKDNGISIKETPVEIDKIAIEEETKLEINANDTTFLLLNRGEFYVKCPVSRYYGLCNPSFKVTNGLLENLKEDISKCASEGNDKLELIRDAILVKLENEFYNNKGVRLCVELESTSGQKHIITSRNLTDCEQAEIRLKIKIDLATDAVSFDLKCASNYLNEYTDRWTAKVQKYQEEWDTPVDVDDLRLQTIRAIEDSQTVLSFFEKLNQDVQAFIGNKIATCVEAVQVSQKITKNIWADAEVNKSTWYSKDSEHTQWPEYARLTPVVGGVSDGVIGEVIGIPIAIKGIYGIMTDDEQREAFLSVFNSEAISALWDSFIIESKEIVSDEERFTHLASRTTIELATLLTPMGTGGKLGDIVGVAADGVKKYSKVPELNKKIEKIAEHSKALQAPNIKKAMKDFFGNMDPNLLEQLMKIENFDKTLGSMIQTWPKFHGEKFVFDNLANKRLHIVEDILSFEAKFDGTNHTADILLESGKKLEYKSWKNDYFGRYLNSLDTKKQLMNYITSWEEGKGFEYIFDRQKLLNGKVADPEAFVKGEFLDMLKKQDNAEKLFNSMSQDLRKLLRIEGDIKTLTDEQLNKFLNTILKIE